MELIGRVAVFKRSGDVVKPQVKHRGTATEGKREEHPLPLRAECTEYFRSKSGKYVFRVRLSIANAHFEHAQLKRFSYAFSTTYVASP